MFTAVRTDSLPTESLEKPHSRAHDIKTGAVDFLKKVFPCLCSTCCSCVLQKMFLPCEFVRRRSQKDAVFVFSQMNRDDFIFLLNKLSGFKSCIKHFL